MPGVDFGRSGPAVILAAFAEPLPVLGYEQEAEADDSKGDPAGLRVEAVDGDGGVSGAADSDQDDQAPEIHGPHETKRDGHQKKSSSDAQVMAVYKEPDQDKRGDQGETFDAGALSGDFNQEAIGPE